MDQDSFVGNGVGEKRVEGGGRICRQRLGKLSVYGSKSKSARPVALALAELLACIPMGEHEPFELHTWLL